MKTDRILPDPGLTEKQARALVCLGRVNGDGEWATACREAFRVIADALDALPPVMEEPTYLGAVVMTSPDGDMHPVVRDNHTPERPWYDPELRDWYSWSELTEPRPITDPDERREHNIPRVLGDDEVALPLAEGSAPGWRFKAEELRAIGEKKAAALADAYAEAIEAKEADR